MADPVILRSYSTADAPGRSVAAAVTTDTNIGHRAPIRRPLRELVPHKDTYAQLAVVSFGGSTTQLYDQSSRGGRGTWISPMLLQSVQFQRSERYQTFISFGAVHYLFFGEMPVSMNVSAIMLDTHNFEQVRDWWANYNDYLRGTVLAERGARIILTYSGYVIEGYMVASGASRDAGTLHMENVTFSIAITSIAHTGTPGDTSTKQEVQDRTAALASDMRVDGTLIRNAAEAMAVWRNPYTGQVEEAPTGGLLDRLRNSAVGQAITEVRDAIEDAKRAAEDFLLGMNQRVPPGEGSELLSLSAAEISKLISDSKIEAQASMVFNNTPGFVSPEQYRTALEAADNGRYDATLRYDEYIENRPASSVSPPGITDAGEIGLSTLQTLLGNLEAIPTADDVLLQGASQRALLEFSKEFPGYTIENGYQASELVRRLGPITYGAIRMAATATGLDAMLSTIGSGVVNFPDDGGAVPFEDALSSSTELSRGAVGAELSGRDMYALQLEEQQRLSQRSYMTSPPEVRF
jgi:hypothetical protein